MSGQSQSPAQDPRGPDPSAPTPSHGSVAAGAAEGPQGQPLAPPPPAAAVPTPNGPALTIVAIGASAGGLDASRKLVMALPSEPGMAFILVQHLDPTHESLMVDLLSGHTTLSVSQAADGVRIERNNLYVIPPGSYLSVKAGRLHVSTPQQRHGARMPFDVLLHSLAADCGAQTACIVLSGTGADGSAGAAEIRQTHGLVIAQDPDEAEYDGMPRSAIQAGVVDHILPVAAMPAALAAFAGRSDRPAADATPAANPPAGANATTGADATTADAAPEADPDPGRLAEIVELVRARTAHDFSLYKPGTLRRRIERRMALAALGTGSEARYLDLLRADAKELDLLSKDLLINVTGFFRDRPVFEHLAEAAIPELVRNHPSDQPIRVWIAGCSTGEEAYSLAILLREHLTATDRAIKLQIFASDVDADAIAVAREGLYPATIAADVSPERLAAFFVREESGYRIQPDLRSVVVFTVQDLLTDPPFSRIDLVSCRNLLIYLSAEAQAKVISLFHFALRKGGMLLLGTSETVGETDGRFEVMSKSARLYRHVGRSRPGDLDFLINAGDGGRTAPRTGPGPTASRPAALAALVRQRVMDGHAPAAVLINRRNECLFSMGPTDQFLSVAPGFPTHDLFAMVPASLHGRLRAAIQRAGKDLAPASVSGGRMVRSEAPHAITIAAEPLQYDGEDLLLICFIEERRSEAPATPGEGAGDAQHVPALERELEQTRRELHDAIRNLELSSEEQRAINEEALSVNEEYQSTNEELLASKEELQSLNEELTALNTQLQETLDRQRTTSDDLQNVLYSTDVATIFLDTAFKIRFFTPATKALFNVIPGDVGRPLADLSSLAADDTLLDDAKAVLRDVVPIERQIEGRAGAWYMRRILPYRTHTDTVAGVVITFTDVTDRKSAADALKFAEQQAQRANAAKSRFLAAASHDLRQPLQTLTLLQGLLAKTVDSDKARSLVGRLNDTIGAMTGMLDILLDINQIEAGVVHAEIAAFAIGDLLARMETEFRPLAEAHGLLLRFVPCSLVVESDARLLEQMLRNLLSNAIKYTQTGRILLGCRRRRGRLDIEVWDTGVGIPGAELQAIFDEYHQIGNSARERGRGLGLGLAIVNRLGDLLGHPVRVRSRPGKGSVFSIEIARAAPPAQAPPVPKAANGLPAGTDDPRRSGTILVVEDAPDVRELLEMALVGEGHRVATAPDGVTALDLVGRRGLRPDVILTDYGLPGGMDGLQVVAALRRDLARHVPVIVLTGDISIAALHDIAAQDCVRMTKPVRIDAIVGRVLRMLPAAAAAPGPVKVAAPRPGALAANSRIFVVDDDCFIREALQELLEADGRTVEGFDSGEAFLAAYRPGGDACLLVDAGLPGMSGLELLRRLKATGQRLPSIMITGNGDVAMAVEAMKAGATDFIEKPVGQATLLAGVARALEQSRDANKLFEWRQAAADQMARLTPRQHQIIDMILAGHPNKNIAADLGISRRTVENHRAAIMARTGAKSLPELARLALASAEAGEAPKPVLTREPPPASGKPHSGPVAG